MCGILVSNSKESLINNVKHIKERGTIAWSLSTGDIIITNKYIKDIEEAIGTFAIDNVINVIHVQSPTSITHQHHPAISDDNRCLWHNGMIDSAYATELGIRDKWDTQYLVDNVLVNGFESLNEFKGSFACIYKVKGEFFCFRNKIAPMFYNKDQKMLISVKLPGTERIEPNFIFKVTSEMDLLPYKSIENNFNPFGV